ncbi:MAG: hypothetical protein BJ554DRAFT_4623 [Olpidium bornovanus]|uniref:Uncharacterized protein n=1 Tax=Olpidium bornovanus TaxID=278681 RepID=A0A8H7ZMT8_9FUNG|nr:MAG: hypothetical protein BJ554DRAFT_4623 [Olpidium bornovanus]
MASDDSPPESAPADPVAPPSGPVQHTDNSPAAAQPAHDPRQPQNIAAESDGGTGSGTALAAEFFAPVEMQHGQEEVAPQGPNGEPGAAVPGAASANADPSPPRTSAFFPVDQITACDGLEPIFLTTQTQELFALVGGRDVTRENPYKAIPKADILSDMLTRLAISDFTPLKQKITPLMEMHEMPPELVSAPVRKEWVSLGSEAEIESMQIHIKFTRKRREFGAPCKFDDRDAGQEVSVECRPYRDANYGLTKMELDVAIQALPVMVDTGVQTTWNRSVNFGVQYEPISYPAQECQARMASQEMKRFVNEVSVRCGRISRLAFRAIENRLRWPM